MGLLDRFKKKKEEKKDAVTANEVKQSHGDEIAASRPVGTRKDTGRAYQLIIRPVLSEKGTHLASQGKYVFVIHSSANKSEVRKGIQKIYDVHVRDVKILKMPSKTRRYGRTVGHTSAFKKAIVTLRAGEKIPGIIESVG